MSSRSERDHWIRFGPFALDTANARLYRGDEVIALRGKTLAVLGYLAARPGQLVTKDDLLLQLWPNVYVSEDVLVGCVRELRMIFGDTRHAARFIETVYRRGYRWIADDAGQEVGGEPVATSADPRRPAPAFVGREDDLAQLREWFERAASGARQVVFVTGEAGIGKTALVNGFIRTLVPPNADASTAIVARGQCVEQYGPAEPFLPILDALERLSRSPTDAWATSTLARCLPDVLLSPNVSTAASSFTIMPERAVRLLGGAVEALAAERVLVLVLEDLHWSDPSTLDVLSYIAQRPEACRLMVLATYRPTELILRRHPLRGLEQELRAHGQSVQLPLGRLTLASVHDWLQARSPSPPPALVEWLYRRTEGHPLFLISLFESIVAAGLVDYGHGTWNVQPGYAEFGVPESLRLMIDRQAESLDDPDRQLLEAASAAGTQFSAATVAAAIERDLLSVEARCNALARDGHFVRAVGPAEWPDGTVAGTYEFIHELYRGTFYGRLSPAHLRLLHQRIGRRLEQGYEERADDVATELSVHFERGRDPTRAARYLEKAATQCTWRGAHREAIAIIRRALEMVALLPDTPERSDRMLFLNLRLGASLLVAEDYADPEVKTTFQRCRQLAERTEALPPLLTALAGLHAYHAARAELTDSSRIIPRMVELAERLPFPQTKLVAHTCAAWSSWSRGDLAAACEHADRAIAAKPDAPMPFPSTFDLVGYAFGTSAFAEMALGNLAAARALSAQGVAWSRQTARPVDRATALALAAMLYACMNDRDVAAERAEEAVTVAEEHGYRQWRATARIIAAWAAAVARRSAQSLADVTARIEEYTAMGLRAQLSPFLCLAADAFIRAGKKQAGIELLDRGEAHARDSGEQWYAAELQRLRGEITQARDPRKAEASFQRAIDVARAQGTKLWELRATVSLATLWQRQEKRAPARQLLEPILSSFPAADDAPDLRAARALRTRL